MKFEQGSLPIIYITSKSCRIFKKMRNGIEYSSLFHFRSPFLPYYSHTSQNKSWKA